MSSSSLSFPALTLVGLTHTGDAATVCDVSLPRVTTYAAMQGLWRPSLTASENGLAALLFAGDGSLFCGLTAATDASVSPPLSLRIITDGAYAVCHHHGPWDTIVQAIAGLRRVHPAGTDCLCLFRTNPRSTAPADWQSELRLLLPR